MRILMLVFNVTGRGTYLRAFNFARGLLTLGHQVTLMATSPQRHFTHKESFQDGIKVIETPDWLCGPLRSGWDLYNIVYRMILLKPSEFDIVQTFETRPVNLLPALILRRAGIPLVFDWADWFGKGGSVEERPNAIIRFLLRPVETFFEEKFRKKASATTVISSTLYDRAVLLGVAPQSIKFIPNGLDSPGQETYQKDHARKELGLNCQDFMIGYVGSLFPRDAKLMADAFDLVVSKIPQVMLMHIGQSRYVIRKLTKYPEKVIHTGLVTDREMALYLAACDVCLLPFVDSNANNGRFPMKISNYLAAGKPVIMTKVGDAVKLVEVNKVGIVSENDAHGLSDAVTKVYQNTDLLHFLGNNSLILSSKNDLSWIAETKKLEFLFYSLGKSR